MIKITSLKIHNIGIIEDTNIPFDKPLLLFYGSIRQGKTTVLNSVRWVCGGSFPTDIIHHGSTEAFIELGFNGGCIRREWYIAKDKSTKARDVQFVRDGKPVPNPVSELKKFLNPFLLNQDYLRNMSELERKKFFVEQFGVDTKALDIELYDSEKRASELRSEIKGFGEIDTTKVEVVDVSGIKSARQAVLDSHAANVRGWKDDIEAANKRYKADLFEVEKTNQDAGVFNSAVDKAQYRLDGIQVEIQGVEARLSKLRLDEKELKSWLNENPKTGCSPRPNAPDMSEISSKILATPDVSAFDVKLSLAAANQVRVEQYQRNQARAEEKRKKAAELESCEQCNRQIRVDRLKKLKDVSDSTGIAELSFDESGNAVYQGTTAGMLSTSQIMKLSSELSGMFPEGFGIELLDRGESLGRSIFDYVELAKREDVTILATIVGQRPATTPPEVGVFVVEDGKVIPDGIAVKKEGELL